MPIIKIQSIRFGIGTLFRKWMCETAQTSRYNKLYGRIAPHRYFHTVEFLWLPKLKRQRLKCLSPDSPPLMRKRLRSAIRQYHRQTVVAYAVCCHYTALFQKSDGKSTQTQSRISDAGCPEQRIV